MMKVNCSNPNCSATYDTNGAQEQALKEGLALAFCPDSVFQVVRCRVPGCQGRVLFRYDAGHPGIDLRGLILVPNPSMLQNAVEQAWILRNRDKWHDFLKFKIIPAWDETNVTSNEFMDAFSGDPASYFVPGFPDIPLTMSDDVFSARLNEENISGGMRLRRLVPNMLSMITLIEPVMIGVMEPFQSGQKAALRAARND